MKSGTAAFIVIPAQVARSVIPAKAGTQDRRV
jgi:hypothetical protein